MAAQDQIQTLHELYVNLTGLEYPLPLQQYWIWEIYIARGYTADDLRLVIKALKRGIANKERRQGCLKFRNLLGDIDLFAEELAMARKMFRPKPAYAPAKAAVLRATGRHDEPQQPEAQPVAVIYERTKLASMLNAWKAANL